MIPRRGAKEIELIREACRIVYFVQQQLEAERQARVEHLATVGLRRIMQQGLARSPSSTARARRAT